MKEVSEKGGGKRWEELGPPANPHGEAQCVYSTSAAHTHLIVVLEEVSDDHVTVPQPLIGIVPMVGHPAKVRHQGWAGCQGCTGLHVLVGVHDDVRGVGAGLDKVAHGAEKEGGRGGGRESVRRGLYLST